MINHGLLPTKLLSSLGRLDQGPRRRMRTPHGCWRVHWDPPAKLSPKIMTTKAGPAPPGAGSHGQIRTVGLLTVVKLMGENWCLVDIAGEK